MVETSRSGDPLPSVEQAQSLGWQKAATTTRYPEVNAAMDDHSEDEIALRLLFIERNLTLDSVMAQGDHDQPHEKGHDTQP
ncbi:MAG: hypothetical protein R2706_05350 [Acidimicrobiales bacterium]